MGFFFSRQEYWSGLPFPSRGSSWPRDQTVSPALQADLYHWATREAPNKTSLNSNWNFPCGHPTSGLLGARRGTWCKGRQSADPIKLWCPEKDELRQLWSSQKFRIMLFNLQEWGMGDFPDSPVVGLGVFTVVAQVWSQVGEARSLKLCGSNINKQIKIENKRVGNGMGTERPC